MKKMLDENYENNEDITENDDAEDLPENENPTKAEKFMRLAVLRMNKLIAGLDSLGKLGNRGSYEYSEDQVDKMFSTLKVKLAEAEAKFKPKGKEKSEGFSFD